MSYAHNKPIFKTIFLAVVFVFFGLISHTTFADTSTTTVLFPVYAVDNTPSSHSRDPIIYSLASSTTPQLDQLQHMAIQDCPSTPNTYFILNKYHWPQHASTYDETQYVEYTFASSTIPSNAVIDNVTLTDSYFFDTNAVTGSDFSKLEFFLGPDADPIQQALTMHPGLGQCNSPANDIIDITSLFSSLDQINNFRVRFLAYETTANGIFTDNDYMGLAVTYHTSGSATTTTTTSTTTTTTPVINPTANAQNLVGVSVDSPFTITMNGSDPNNAALTYSIVNNPSKGTLGAVSGNQVQYTPNGTIGDDSFTFKVNNGSVDSDPATVTLHLVPGATASLVVSAADAGLNTGSSTTLTISGKDKFGNYSTSDNSTVVAVSSDIGTVADSNVTLGNGVATTSASSLVAGTATYTVQSGALTAGSISVAFSDPVDIADPATTPHRNGGHGGPVGGGASDVAVVNPSSGGNTPTAPSVPAGVDNTVSSNHSSSDNQVADAVPAEVTPSSGSDQSVTAPESAVPDEVAVPSQGSPTDGSVLGAAAGSAGTGDTTTKELIVSLSIILIAGIYVSVWKPFRKKI